MIVAFLPAIVVFAGANEPNTTTGLVQHGLAAAEFGQLSVEEKADILSGVVESSYKILANVPEKGLTDSLNSLRQVVKARKWMEDTTDIVAWMLAFRLQYCVDSGILNELYRSEKLRLGQPVQIPFEKGSFDDALITLLLKQNAIDERKYLEFALGLDTKVARFCRDNNYGVDNFLNGRVFRKAAEKMKLTFELPVHSEGKLVEKQTKQLDVREGYFGMFIIEPVYAKSKENAKKVILPLVLRAIDDARDARLVTRVYQKYSGFADTVKPGWSITHSEDFKCRLVYFLRDIRNKSRNRDLLANISTC